MVVAVGVTVTEPLVGSADELTEGEMVTAEAFEVCHCSVTCCPDVIVVAFADKVAVGAGSGCGELDGFELPQEHKTATIRTGHNRETGGHMTIELNRPPSIAGR